MTDAAPLHLGSKGPAVEALQRHLGIDVDGDFGAATEAAVRAFQTSRGIVADGIVGPYTLRELAIPTSTNGVQNVVATVFGGYSDVEKSAYDGHRIGETECAVALPYRFQGVRPKVKVTNRANGKSVTCSVEDVGPWNEDDPYFLDGRRPNAESGRDTRGRRTNRAGIDLSPAAAKAIGIDGMGSVDFELIA